MCRIGIFFPNPCSIGQTAQLLSVSNHVGTVFEDPNLDPILVSNASNNTVVKQNQAGNQSIQRKTGSTQLRNNVGDLSNE